MRQRKRKSRPDLHQTSIIQIAEHKPMAESEVAIAKNAFISNVSHEIRTPMNAIMGFAQMLQSTALNTKQSDYVDVILDSGKKLLILINNLLDLSNLQLGKTTLHPVDCNLEQLVTKVWNHYRPLIAAKNLNPILERPEQLPMIQVDCEKVERVLSFILSNALKFTLKGSITLRLTLNTDDQDMGQLVFEVEDTGCGIEPERLKYIFDVFEQGDNSVTRAYPGMGLGLSLSSRLVELLGGKIGATSSPHRGSCFHFQIPVQIY